jgi:hypothetical protein
MISIERHGKRFRGTLDDVQNGDVVSGNFTADEPRAILENVTDVTLRGNMKNVLLDEPVTLTDVNDTVVEFPAAKHTKGWLLDGLHHCYALRSVEEREEARQRAIAELEEAFDTLDKFFPRLKAEAKEKPAVLSRLQTKFRSLFGRAEAAAVFGCTIPKAGVQGEWADVAIEEVG